MPYLIGLIILLVVLVSAGCQATRAEFHEPLAIEASPSVTRMPDLPTITMDARGGRDVPLTRFPERVPSTLAMTPVTGEVPARLLEAIVRDLAKSSGAALDKISVTQAENVVWSDGSLGCPQPGAIYTQALTPGYKVILDVDGKRYDYRATETGYFLLCEAGMPPISPRSTPNS